MSGKSWQEIAEIAQDLRDKSIAHLRSTFPDIPCERPLNISNLPGELLSKAEIRITETSPEHLLDALASGKLTSIQVTRAFLRRAGLAQKLANCVTELLPSAALKRANYLDDYFATYKKPLGPLHGLPISVQEHVGTKDLRLKEEYVSWWDHNGQDDALILKLLWYAGYVFCVRTTQPRPLMHLETSSNLYGDTICPFNRNLTSGGNSGSKGALAGLWGSCLGIGADIGGSIRSPAASNGVYGFRPTSYRLPVGGFTATMLGQEHIIPVIGPLSTSVQGCKIFTKTLLDQKPWQEEPSLLPFPWRDGPHAPVVRALKDVSEKLKSIAAVEIAKCKSYRHDRAWEILSSLYFADGAKEEKEAIEASGEPWRPLSRFIITEQPCCTELSVAELWSWTMKREAYWATYTGLWNKLAVDGDTDTAADVSLCPVGPGAAPLLNQARYWGYTSQWNLLDYPALVFPMTRVDQEKDQAEVDHEPTNEQDDFNHKLFSPATYVVAPVTLQLVGRRYEDEKVFEALEFMRKAIGLPWAS